MRTFYICLCLLPFLFSCEMKRDLFGSGKEPDQEISYENLGLLDLELDAKKEPAAPNTKGDGDENETLNPDDFSISVIDSLGQVVERYGSYTEMREAGDLLLPVGSYTIKAESGSNPNAGFNSPYYAGDTLCVISAKEVAKVITNCYLQNKKVQFECSDDFLKKFNDDYSIIIDNGIGVIVTSRLEDRVAYLKNTGTLRFTIYASTLDNKACTYSYDLSKESQTQGHNNIFISLDAIEEKPDSPDDPDDNEPDVPGDPGDPDSPENPEDPDKPVDPDVPEHPVKLPVIKVDVSLIEKDYVIEVPSDFVESGKPGTDGGGDNEPDNPGDDGDNPDDGGETAAKPTIVGDGFSIDSPVNVKVDNADKTTVKVNIKTPGKLASLQIKISDNMTEALNMVQLPLSFDMCNLDPKVEKTLLELGLAMPEVGASSNVFDISSFIPLIAILGADTYSFTIKAVDEAGQSIEKELTIVMKE